MDFSARSNVDRTGIVATRFNRTPRHCRHRHRGAALLMSMFIIVFVTVMLVSVFDTETLQLAAHRNTIDYERALYLAGAAVHHAAAELENNQAWRGTVTDGSYPNDDTYQATAVDGVGSSVIITGIGVAGEVTRRLQVTIVHSN